MNGDLKRELSDYATKRLIREETEKKSRHMGFIILELKQYFQNRLNSDYEYGYIYKYVYVTKYNSMVTTHIPYEMRNRMEQNKFNDPAYANAISKTLNKPVEITDAKNIYESLSHSNKRYLQELMQQKFPKPMPEYGATLRVRVTTSHQKFNYSLSYTHSYSHLNLKNWDKKTKKTSNKGIRADTSYTYSNGKHICGWRFGFLDTPSLKEFCIDNGFKNQKGKTYCYGHYAEWMLHVLE